MITLYVSMFGKLNVQWGDQPVKGLESSKDQELFCYLLIHRDRAHSREMLASLLWGDSSTEKSKKYLRQSLWHLQHILEPQGNQADERILVVEHDWVRLNSKAALRVDVAEFEQAYAQVKDLPGAEIDEERARLLKEAVKIYQGDLLEGCYQEWCLFERERLQNMYLSILDKLLSHCGTHRLFEEGQAYGSLILSYDRAHERTHQQLMRLHGQAGNRTGALRQYERCVAALDEELGVRPSKQTESLLRIIRDDHSETPGQMALETQGQPVFASFTELLNYLKQLRFLLVETERRISQGIEAAESGLKLFKNQKQE